MSNPFDDLKSDDDTNPEGDGVDDSGDDSTESVGEQSDLSPVSEPDHEPIADEPEDVDPADSGPAFEYSEVRQKPLYARDETWSEFEKTFRTRIAPLLAESDVVDEETREVHDAVLRVANEQPERVAELILEARRES